MNLYGYVQGNPVRYTDRRGLDALIWSVGIGGQGGLWLLPNSTIGKSGSIGVGVSWGYWGSIPILNDFGIVTTTTTVTNYNGGGYGATFSAAASPVNTLTDAETGCHEPSKNIDFDFGPLEFGPIGGMHVGDDGSVSFDVGLGGQSFGGYGASETKTNVYSFRRLIGQ